MCHLAVPAVKVPAYTGGAGDAKVDTVLPASQS